MPKRISYGGKVHVFPDDFTDADISAALEGDAAPPAKSAPADVFRGQLSRMGSFGAAPTPKDIEAGNRGGVPGLTMSAMAAPALAGAPILSVLKGLGLGVLGSAAGGAAGKAVGTGLEAAGAPSGTSGVTGTVGGLVGGLAGPIKGPAGLLKLAELSGGKGGMLAALARKALPEAVEGAAAGTAAKTIAPEVARKAELDIAIKEARLAKLAADAKRAEEIHQARLAKAAGTASKPGPRLVPKPAPKTEGATALKPEPEMIPDEAVSLVAEPLPFKPRGTVKPATNLGGPAKPGPAPTPPDKLEETLRASIEAEIAKKGGSVRGKSALVDKALENVEGMHQRSATAGMTEKVAARRKAIGADKLAKELGMDADVIRSDAGDVVGEALGAHSPIIPADAWKKIQIKMLSLPPSERVAYVERATNWARPQIEQLRRTYENLGIAMPLAVGGGLAAREVSKQRGQTQ